MGRILKARRIIICACGTSWHSALVGEYMIESLAKIPVEVEYASEFRYRKPIIFEDDVVIAISQSGETADTLEAIHIAKAHGALALGLVNVVGSSVRVRRMRAPTCMSGPRLASPVRRRLLGKSSPLRCLSNSA